MPIRNVQIKCFVTGEGEAGDDVEVDGATVSGGASAAVGGSGRTGIPERPAAVDKDTGAIVVEGVTVEEMDAYLSVLYPRYGSARCMLPGTKSS